MDCLPATQSEIFALSAENSKIVRTLAGFLLSKGTGEAQIRASAPDLCPILSVESRAGALSANLRSYCNCPWSWNLTGSGPLPRYPDGPLSLAMDMATDEPL